VRHYYGPLYKSLAESGQWREAPPDPDRLLPERVPATIDQTDVLLALWIGEAMLNEEGFRQLAQERSVPDSPTHYARPVRPRPPRGTGKPKPGGQRGTFYIPNVATDSG
jgi:hypothetical protein